MSVKVEYTDFANSAKLFFHITRKCFKSTAEKLLKFHHKSCSSAPDVQNQLTLLNACQHVLDEELWKNMFVMNIKLVVILTSLNGKKKKFTFEIL